MRRKSIHPFARAALVVGVAANATNALAQDESLDEKLERLEKIIEQQQRDLENQRQDLAEQHELIRQLQQQLETSPPPASEPAQVAVVEEPDTTDKQVVTQQDIDRVAQEPTGQQAAEAELARREQEPQLPPDNKEAVAATLYDPSSTVYDENFPGAWHLPGTTAAMKIGGFINATVVTSFDPMLITDRFITGSIPPTGLNVPGARTGTEVTASQTRLNYEVREQTSQGQLRAFLEADFEGEGDTFRLRHAFGQFKSVLAGKTWTTFMDADARPEEVDFEGINGELLARQTQIRFFPKLGEEYSLKVALEDPQTDIGNGVGTRGSPDLVASVGRVPFGDLGVWNYRVAVIVRDLEGQQVEDGSVDPEDPSRTRDAVGWGISTSGRHSFSKMGEGDALLWQLTYGHGIGRYFNDLNTIGGGDAVFDPSGELQPLPVWGGYVSYRHHWPMRWAWVEDWPGILRSNFTISGVWIDNYEYQEPLDYHSTLRVSANILYFPTPNVRIGAELLWGQRTNKNKSKGDASQMQISARYNF